ncbi:MAG: SDR family oxidoreductase [Planctomycetaceae bacterium]|nr:SDR family oxidoreductase [Planctomycetaceae bacterium]
MERPPGKVSFDNRGRVAIVTGVAGGIGWAIAQGFADSGATVYGLDLGAAPAVDERIVVVNADVSDRAQVESSVARIIGKTGGVDVLVNNAAIQPVDSFRPLHQIEPQLLEQMLRINVGGYNWVARSVLPQMIQQQSGVIVNLASAHAWRSSRDVPGYGPTKAANRMQAVQWALDYARQGVRVVSVSPGAIDTPLVRASLEKQGGEGALANRHPLGRLGKPEEIAAAVIWLASPGASFVTATDLEVDGGLGGFGSFADPYMMPSRYEKG